MSIIPTKYVLLTGAGFSKNFGGWTGNELRKVIITNLHKPELQQIFIEDEDYENAYTNAIENSELNADDKTTISKAVKQSYAGLCNNMRARWSEERGRPGHMFANFIRPFLNFKGNERPFFFTLNQDLFLEDKKGWFSPKAPKLEVGKHNFEDLEFEQITATISPEIKIEDIEKDVNNHAGPAYIKLHGSYGWYSSNGQHRLVIGNNKTQQIKDEPLLDWYFQIFKQIMGAQKNILVIGYSFKDKHINDALFENTEKHNGKILIINPSIPENIGSRKNVIFYPRTLLEIIQDNQQWIEIQRQLFN
ncbi:MAG: SIR2 family protein [Candidatus Gracilibacteria bacterium]